MLSQQSFREVVSGNRKGVLANLLRSFLAVVEVVYRIAVRIRNARYDRDPSLIHQCAVPVICVGNLTLGGTGKTPMVRYLADRLSKRGKRVAIVSRGYRSSNNHHNDEAVELAQHLPNVPHIQNPNRVLASRQAVEQYQVDVILLDDGLQHRRLGRDLDLVLLDALEPFGYDHVFPRGTLREPIEGMRRAQVVGLTRSDAVSTAARARIRERVVQLCPHAVWLELAHRPVELRGFTDRRAVSGLRNQRVLAFCGIGNPHGFRSTLKGVQANLVDFVAFPDHHSFTKQDCTSLRDLFDKTDAELAVCTHKDFVKLEPEWVADLPIFALIIELQVLEGESELDACLERALTNRQHDASG